MIDVLVIGAGPAGLMAADVASAAGAKVLIVDQMPSPGRKFQMAGKSGLNLTKKEPAELFLARFSPDMAPFVQGFGPDQVQDWAQSLGQDIFTGSTGRVFPKVMKAAPLLRAWLARLRGQGVVLNTRWRWTGWDGPNPAFETPEGAQTIAARATILAVGGATWRRLGSDGAWAAWTDGTTEFAPANGGLRVNWTPHMARFFGQPLKGIRLSAGGLTGRGECVVTPDGLEGGGIYEVSRALRGGAALTLDLKPDMTEAQIAARLAKTPAKASLPNRLRKAIKLGPLATAMLREFTDLQDLPKYIKALSVSHQGAMPLDQAISAAGGLRFDGLDGDLMIQAQPGVFAAGEMLDWEAPTGGYLITGCLATGRAAGQGALRFLGLS